MLDAAGRFVSAGRRGLSEPARDLLEALGALQDDELVFLEARIRSWGYWFHGWRPIEQRRQLLTHRNPTVASAGLALAAMGPDGYLREQAVAHADPTVPLWLKLCLIRASDWVPQVAQAAVLRLQDVDAVALVCALPLASRVAGRGRGTALREHLDEALGSESGKAALVDAAVRGAGEQSRLAWFELLRRHAEAAAEHFDAGLRHPDVRVREHALNHVDRLAESARRDVLSRLARDPVGRIRADALSKLFELEAPTSAGLEPHLEDRSALVRGLAQRWLRRAGGDPAERYRSLATRGPTRWNVAGLAETGTADDTPILESLLANPSDAIRTAALTGLARLDRERSLEVAWAALDDASSRVSRTAIAILMAVPDPMGATADLLLDRVAREGRAPVRRQLLHAVSRSPWHRLAVAAGLRNDDDADIRGAAREILRLWPSEIAHLSTKPRGIAERELARHLPNLDPELRRVVEFVIRTSAQQR
ncbi:MAG: hypothetical protein AB1416_08450 [Actinomycetota bacterium]